MPEKVREVGEYVRELAESLRTALDSAAKDVESLTNGNWTGAAATDFGAGWTDVRDGGTQIMAALTGMAEKLGVAANAYQTRDEGNASSLRAATFSLDLP
ncbi:type VII secretion target [Nocardia tenerifensis]|uniref:type VII secretion target n=1 Tax=Nocardia tenerifensis TaxID=228006 RepID=UPI00030A9405|nr:type VII secretion target [Nocardia tenerifensis]